MKLTVYGASSSRIDQKYIDAVEDFGDKASKRGHGLVFGAGKHGLMGAVARGFSKNNGYIHGFIPKFFNETQFEVRYDKCTETTYTETMAERKQGMENSGDAFIIVPGGVGTFEEFFQTLTLKQLGRHNKPIVLFNIDGYFDGLKKYLEEVSAKKFIAKECLSLFKVFDKADDILDYVESYDEKIIPWQILKDPSNPWENNK